MENRYELIHWQETSKVMGKKLFSFGSNSHGQLGTGTTSDAHIPIECILPAGAEPLSVSSTTRRTASQRELTTFEYLDIAPDPSTQFTHIACGFNHSLALDSSHNVYAWGENSCGQVDGVPSKIPCSPIVIPLPTPAAAIAASLRYSAALLQNGEVWVWGDFVGQFHIILATKSGSVVVIMTGGSKKNRFGQWV
ncbi:RCC1/BLIP-II protein [Rhizoclosmatium globosum]|uniref:RCC1/BLIP-II protein n=1 Tax=Rhizoclosmatium globosum TaxID=329046 RepID=A0A1Y2CHC6_9FUNG|nr:RCC1/BLIP-II protein [Rhizoclosmatium globosum]|eukprot:ORY46412.1 RCC1/BLIP-II protein [Rhizoclosmatium globosum]